MTETDDIETIRRAAATVIDEVAGWRVAVRFCIAMLFAFTVASVWVACGEMWGLISGACAFACSAAWCAARLSVSIASRDVLMNEFKEAKKRHEEEIP